ncbi:MAG: hypothetical protein AAFP93_00895 [Bacteroidota bacterium]
MRLRIKDILLRLLGLEFLCTGITGVMLRQVYSLSPNVRATVRGILWKGALVLFIVNLGSMVLFFALLALATYFNEILASSYQGFLIISVGGTLMLLLFLWPILRRIHWL